MVVKITYHCDNQILEWQWASNNPLMPTPYFTSCYLVDGLLIDSGAPGGENDLRNFVRSLNVEETIDKCFITHTHEDHAGGAHILNIEFKIPVYTSAAAKKILKVGNTYPDYRQLAWGSKLLPVEARVEENSIVTKSKKYRFDLFPMIGHAPDLVALIEKKQQWAFVADAVQPKYKMIFGGDSDIQEDIALIYQSLQELYLYTEGMDNLLIFSAGNGVFQGREFLSKKMDEINDLRLKVHKYYKELIEDRYPEKQIVKKILSKMFGKENVIGQLTRGALSRRNLILSLLEWPLK